MKLKLAVLLIVAGFLQPAHAENNAAASAAIQAARAATAQPAPARGALYRIHHEGRTAYLYGTIHVGRPEFVPLGAEVERALAQAHKLVLELDIRDERPLQGALQKHGLYAEGDGIESHLSAQTMTRLRQTLERFGMPLAQVQRMKPWLVANLLMGLDLDRNGYRRQYGAEYALLASASGKTIGELETAEYQMSLFDSMDAAQQEAYLNEAMTELDDGRALKKARALIDAWAGADHAGVERVWKELREEDTSTSAFTQRVLLDQRNPDMANKVEALLREEERSFVGVGMLHLIGDGGLPALLRQRGYRVERVY